MMGPEGKSTAKVDSGRTALITGITGQDGSYLADLLLAKGYTVHGLVRRASSIERSRLKHLYSDAAVYNRTLFLHYADLEDTTTIRRVVSRLGVDEFYHLAGQSHVGLSFEIPESTCELTAMCTLRILEILRDLEHPPRFLHASSREIFGTPVDSPQDENTPVHPESPYGCAKAFATQMAQIYRETHGMFCCNTISYNHESPRRGENFVTRKISMAAARISLGLQKDLRLGDIHASRDWGHARDFVQAMWLALQHDQPGDYVLASGQSHSVSEFLNLAFAHVGLSYEDYLIQETRYQRPHDVDHLLGDSGKAREELGWRPQVSFENLVLEMVEADLQIARAEKGSS
jgi:GDPmannose 4,6-dehydratase